MIIFERDKPKNLIIWSTIFLLTQLFGFIAYIVSRIVFTQKYNSLLVKLKEDEIYKKLVNKSIIKENKVQEEIFEFNNLAYNASSSFNNSFEFINNNTKFEENLLKDIRNASKFIIFETNNFNFRNLEGLLDILKQKIEHGIIVKFVYDGHVALKIKKQLKSIGVKVYKFSKHSTLGRVYSNLRNIISIDGKICYLANLNSITTQSKFEVSNTIIKLKGEVVNEIDLMVHEDTIFASGKFLKYSQVPVEQQYGNCAMQFVCNQINTNIELILIKAICTAKKSIYLHLSEFIPTESIMSLLRFAINSNIDVKLIVPLKNYKQNKYYASRAYAKELALIGANVYLFDGYIFDNSVIVDSNYVIAGSFIVDREHISNSLQSIILMKDEKVVSYFNKQFDLAINNSYRISNAKLMLLREKFFKNFI